MVVALKDWSGAVGGETEGDVTCRLNSIARRDRDG